MIECKRDRLHTLQPTEAKEPRMTLKRLLGRTGPVCVTSGELIQNSIAAAFSIKSQIIEITDYGLEIDDRGSKSDRGWELFSSTPRPDRLWSPPSLLFSGYQGLFSGDKAAWE
jgi:hypothetical protein